MTSKVICRGITFLKSAIFIEAWNVNNMEVINIQNTHCFEIVNSCNNKMFDKIFLIDNLLEYYNNNIVITFLIIKKN